MCHEANRSGEDSPLKRESVAHSQEEGLIMPWGAQETPGSSGEAGRERRRVGRGLYCGFHRKAWERQGE